MERLCLEIKTKGLEYGGYEVKSIFLGGGTPSILTGEQMLKILTTVKASFRVDEDCEITAEVNPGTVAEISKLSQYKDAGINRLSIGLQSTHNKELKMLGRIHTYEEFLDTWQMVKECGFDNANVDLISALPGQTKEDMKENLDRIVKLGKPLTHVSVYSLIIEEGTPFYSIYDSSDIDEDLDRELYSLTNQVLSEYGFKRYEISNYALPGYECRHNLVYWDRGNYLGLGLGASSMVENVRWKNQDSLDDYMSSWKKNEVQVLSVKEQMEEFMFLGLRKLKGVSIREFTECFGISLPEQYLDVIQRYTSMGMMKKVGENIMLTDAGLNVSNTIMADFLFSEYSD